MELEWESNFETGNEYLSLFFNFIAQSRKIEFY